MSCAVDAFIRDEGRYDHWRDGRRVAAYLELRDIARDALRGVILRV
jgi:hypothetical protein